MTMLGQDILNALRRRTLGQAAAGALAEAGRASPILPSGLYARPEPPETITAEPSATLGMVAPVRRHDFAADVRREFINGTPEQREAVLRSELGPAYDVLRSPATDKFRALQSAGPSTHQPSGFWSRAKDALIGAGLGARRGGDNPLAALGGMVGGAVGAAVDPDLAHRLRYEDVELPRAYRESRAEQEVLGEEIGRAMKLGSLSGINPYTGEPTQSAENQALRNEIARQRAETYARGQESLINARDRRADVSELNAILRARTQGGTLQSGEIARIQQQYGVTLPPTYDPKKHQLIVDAKGNYQVVDVGQVGSVTTTSGQPVTSIQGRRATEAERHNRELEAINRVREQRLATSGGTQKVTKVDVQVAVTDEWIKSGRTPSGKTIEDGNVVEGYTRTPLEEHAEYKREVNRRYSVANKKPAKTQAATDRTITAADYEDRVKRLGGDDAARAKVDAKLKELGITVR